MKEIQKKSERGSITLFVLLACLFFLLTVTSVGMFVKNKENAVEAEYQKIKQSYQNVDVKE